MTRSRPALIGATLALLAAGLGLSPAAVGARMAGAVRTPAAVRAPAVTGTAPTLTTCAADLYGTATRARLVTTSAPAALAAEFSAFRRPATSADAYRSPLSLSTLLGANDVSSYDTRGVRVIDTDAQGDDIYLVAVTLQAATVPAACAHLRAFRGFAPALKLQQEATGSGPGVCAVPTVLTGGQGRDDEVAAGVACESLGALHRYYGLLGLPAQLGQEKVVVVPDAVATLTVGYLHGAHVVESVAGDLARAPLDRTGVSGPLRQSESLLNRDVPTSVTELGAAGRVIARSVRPAGALALFARANDFGLELAAALGTGSTGP